MDNQKIEKLQYHYTTKTGRPTKYLASVINPKVEEYLSQCSNEQMQLPTIEGLAKHLGVISETIREWVVQYPEFSANIKRLGDAQRNNLIHTMYSGREINGSMAIFLLKALHGFKENEPSTLIQVNIKPILGNLDPE